MIRQLFRAFAFCAAVRHLHAATPFMGLYQMKGRRSYMEDTVAFSEAQGFYAIFDGHGGDSVSFYLRDNIKPVMESQSSNYNKPLSPESYSKLMTDAIESIDEKVLANSRWSRTGSTVLMLQLITDNESTKVVVANAGDCRAAILMDGATHDLSIDHKPDRTDERVRIENAGGFIAWDGDVDAFKRPIKGRGIYRVSGNLAISRSVGDGYLRPYVISEPEFITRDIGTSDYLIVMASDGLWDVFSSSEALDFARQSLARFMANTEEQKIIDADGNLSSIPSLYNNKLLNQVAESLALTAHKRGSGDNISVIVLAQQQMKKKKN